MLHHPLLDAPAAPVPPPLELVVIKSDTDATSTIEFIVENLFIFILPGPITTGACLSISTSHTSGLGTTLPPIFEAIAEQSNLLLLLDVGVVVVVVVVAFDAFRNVPCGTT